MSDLVNSSGIAERLGVGNAAVSNWPTRYPDFPSALDLPGVLGIPLYSWQAVRSWAVRTGRLTDRKG